MSRLLNCVKTANISAKYSSLESQNLHLKDIHRSARVFPNESIHVIVYVVHVRDIAPLLLRCDCLCSSCARHSTSPLEM